MSIWIVVIAMLVGSGVAFGLGRVTASRRAQRPNWGFRMVLPSGSEIRGDGLTQDEVERAHAYWRGENDGRG